jgi:uncharacterized membrane protein (DUF2068 family)
LSIDHVWVNWNLRTCARRGHVHFRPDEEWARVGLTARHHPEGETLLYRCLRCAGFFPVDGEVPAGPVAAAPGVARDRELRDLFVLRVLAAERGVRGALMLLLGVAVLAFRGRQQSLRASFDDLLPAARPLAEKVGIDVNHGSLVTLAHHILQARATAVLVVALGLVAYGVIQLVEGVGLWLAKRWGEYLSVVATSAFLPLETYEVVDKASLFKAAAMVVNILAVAWLVWTKRLFGARGGHEALIASRRGESVIVTMPPEARAR